MYKESEVNLDDIVKALLESELGFYCFNLIIIAKICTMYYQKKYIRGQDWDVWL